MADTSSVSNVSASVVNGSVVDTTTKTTTTTASGYDKDAFMNILVAQMKYQDPLEPTSNTEYISQYAQFSQVEQLQNMADAMTLSRASDLVGKTVIINQTSEATGQTTQIQGVVDFVTYSGGEAYLSIDGTNYKMDDLYAVADTEYIEAQETAEEFSEAISKLPATLEEVTLDDADTINNLGLAYDNFSDKVKSFISSTDVTTLKQYILRVAELQEAADV
ncbi:MAG: flagellar hook capping protein [Butyrivibrio sp.]|nr:flagellar hook capping protein [Butyrivibrio sp.]